MKQKILIALGIALAGGLLIGGTALADSDDGWAIGYHDDSSPFAASAEYPFFGYSSVDWVPGSGPDGSFFSVYDYSITPPQDADPINAPNFPGYIGQENVCDVDIVANNPNDQRPCVMTAQQVNIHFTLTCDYASASDLVFVYSRYGSENDDLLLDDEFFATVNPGGEFGHEDFSFDLGPLSSGEHVLSIVYGGGGTGNGHYVDELTLEAVNPNCNLFADGRMTGGGSVFTADGTRVTHGFELHCDAAVDPNNLEINWGGRGRNAERFHLETLDLAACSDDPALDEGSPVAGFDTYVGSGTGSYNGVSGYTAEWTFTDDGEPGTSDLATIVIYETADPGNVVLTVSGFLQNGNQQAH